MFKLTLLLLFVDCAEEQTKGGNCERSGILIFSSKIIQRVVSNYCLSNKKGNGIFIEENKKNKEDKEEKKHIFS